MKSAVLLRHQLAVPGHSRQKPPHLRQSDRFLLGTLSLLVLPRRLFTVSIVIQPATLLKFHRALVEVTLGGSIAVVCFKHQSRRHYQFAMHTVRYLDYDWTVNRQ
jgi:hypothetical protein